ncbi:MAG: AMP-binding protein, partial [Acidobacteria bacterium]
MTSVDGGSCAAVSPRLRGGATGFLVVSAVDSPLADNLDCPRLDRSYLSRPARQPLQGETIGSFLDRTVAQHGECEALVSRHQGTRYTYRALDASVRLLARGLLALGLQKGDRVALWSANTAEWLITQYAAARSGGILVSLNPAYRLREVEYALNLAGVTILIAAPRFRDTDHVALLQELAPELRTCAPGNLAAARLPSLKHIVYTTDAVQAGAWRWSEVMELGKTIPDETLRREEQGIELDDPVSLQFTSGTTGKPKGAVLSHHSLVNNGFFIGERLQYTPADRVCVPVPLFHCFGMVDANLSAMTHGSAIVLPSETFDPLASLQTIEAERCTSLYGVPTMFIAELEHPRFDEFNYDSLRTGLTGGAPVPIELMRRITGRFKMREFTVAYGMTEMSGVSFQSEPDDHLDVRCHTVGAMLPHMECKIVDSGTCRIVPRGTPGEVCMRGYMVMRGYWNDPEATNAAIDEAGWMHTGDVGILRDDGYAQIVGRIKDMIIRGGENISPREIEEFLYTHPAVSQVSVIGIPDPTYGEEVCAWVSLKEGATVTEEEIRQFCKGQIATYKIPRVIRFTREFPMTASGKI